MLKDNRGQHEVYIELWPKTRSVQRVSQVEVGEDGLDSGVIPGSTASYATRDPETLENQAY
jgi:hypothetical protein